MVPGLILFPGVPTGFYGLGRDFAVPGGQRYRPLAPFPVEGDASQEAFWHLANFLGSSVSLAAPARSGLQGDAVFPDLLARLAAAPGGGPPPEIEAPPVDAETVPARRVRPARRLYLKLDSGQREAALRILAETPGGICVMLYMADEKKTYQAPREYWVDEGYDFGALANLIGADNIVLKG